MQAAACSVADGEQAAATSPGMALHMIGRAERVRSNEFRSTIWGDVTGTVESERDGILEIRRVLHAPKPVTISTLARPAIPTTGV